MRYRKSSILKGPITPPCSSMVHMLYNDLGMGQDIDALLVGKYLLDSTEGRDRLFVEYLVLRSILLPSNFNIEKIHLFLQTQSFEQDSIYLPLPFPFCFTTINQSPSPQSTCRLNSIPTGTLSRNRYKTPMIFALPFSHKITLPMLEQVLVQLFEPEYPVLSLSTQCSNLVG